MLEGVEDGGTGSVRQIQFTRGVRSKIVADDPIDFGPERLDCDWKLLAHASIGTEANSQDCHFSPICALASSTESATVLLELATPEMKDCLSYCGVLIGDNEVSAWSNLNSYSVISPLGLSAVRGG